MPNEEDVEFIGTAIMKDNGIIILNLRAESGQILGDGQIIYTPSHPMYEDILAHLGGLKPGEEKGVPPWQDE